ncbi:hypothetical protein LTR97_012170 [Elasticomyces elasticus]|uniref:F-box domain-containing protein n=1 Tax=Elasticomyces elasticus TaxID=574655 RepID=A0AAN7W0P6_9PEZI|nr:hypothetical protein LTR97_012170 [Elasticomyces elasticus]
MELTTTTPSSLPVKLIDFPREILLHIFGYVVWTAPAPKKKLKPGKTTNERDYHSYLRLVARLMASKLFYEIAKEAYFTQHHFSLRLGGWYSLPPTRGYCFQRWKAFPIAPLSAFKKGTFADRNLYYDNVRRLDVTIDPTFLTSTLALVRLLRPILEACQQVASMDVLILSVTTQGIKTEYDVEEEDQAEAVTMIKDMVAKYEKRVNKSVKMRWL